MQAWRPFACGRNNFFSTNVLKQLAEKYNKTSGQIALKYLIQSGVSVIPKTSKKERLKENISVFDFSLTNEDMTKIQTLDTGKSLFGWYK